MGLLSKASKITSVNKLAFSKFIITHNIKTFAIFQQKDKYYSICTSIGIDGASLLSSLSTADFWNGICPKDDTPVIFKNDINSLNPMLQFFTFELMEEIKEISLYRHNNKVYMLCDKQFNQAIINDLDNLDIYKDSYDLNEICIPDNEDNKLLKFEIDFKEAVANFISIKGKDIENKEDAKQVLYNELYNRFSCYISKYLTKRINSNSLRVIINVNKNIKNEHLICHLVSNFKTVIGATAEIITFNYCGEVSDKSEIKEFLQVE